MENKTEVEIRYLYHSGFTVKTASHFFVFDYYPVPNHNSAEKGMAVGLIEPYELNGLHVVVFSSHGHGDHFAQEIFRWKETAASIQFVLSDDIVAAPEENCLMVSPNCEYQLEDLEIKTLKSTDEGVAFLIKADGLCIYHAGDLNWWHWNGESNEYNNQMGKDYQKQIDLIKDETVDLAFVPMDPRLEDKFLLGINYFCSQVVVQMVFPMHFGENDCVFDWLQKDAHATEYRGRIQTITHRGQIFHYEK